METRKLSKGAYYIGDPVHVLSYDKWSEFYEKTDNFVSENLELDGAPVYVVDLEYIGVTPNFELKTFTDNYNNKYQVKAGLLGVLPLGKIDVTEEEIKNNKYGSVFLFENDFTTEFNEGVLNVGNVIINTN